VEKHLEEPKLRLKFSINEFFKDNKADSLKRIEKKFKKDKLGVLEALKYKGDGELDLLERWMEETDL